MWLMSAGLYLGTVMPSANFPQIVHWAGMSALHTGGLCLNTSITWFLHQCCEVNHHSRTLRCTPWAPRMLMEGKGCALHLQGENDLSILVAVVLGFFIIKIYVLRVLCLQKIKRIVQRFPISSHPPQGGLFVISH